MKETKEETIHRTLSERYPEANTMKDIGLKLGEEAGEVMGAIVKLPEGRATLEDLDDEIGDVLIVLARLAALRDTTLAELLGRRWLQILRRDPEPKKTLETSAFRKAMDFMAQAHPLVIFSLEGEQRCEDIAGAGYELAESFGYDHENGCELWPGESKELPDGRIQIAVVVSADSYDERDLGMLWVGRMGGKVDGSGDFPAFLVEEVTRHGLVAFDPDEVEYFWTQPEGAPKFVRLGKGGSVLRLVSKPGNRLEYFRDAGGWSVYSRLDAVANEAMHGGDGFLVTSLKKKQLPTSLLGTLLTPATEAEWRKDNEGYVGRISEEDEEEEDEA